MVFAKRVTTGGPKVTKREERESWAMATRALGAADAHAAAPVAVQHTMGMPVTVQPTMGMPAPVLFECMTFPNGQAAKYLVQDYALAHNKQVRVGLRGGKHRRLLCSSETPCPFYVQFYQRRAKTDNSWYLSSMNLTHSVECTSMAKPTKRQIVELAKRKGALNSTQEETASSLATFLDSHSHTPLRLNLRTIYRAKKELESAKETSQSHSFKRIPSLLTEFASLNEGSIVSHDVDDRGCFLRAFVSCGVFTGAARAHLNQQVFGFECIKAPSNNGGVQMYLFGCDGNRKPIVLAAAVCLSVSEENLEWFFCNVHSTGIDTRGRPIIAPAMPELEKLEPMLRLTIRYCTKHLIESELSKRTCFNQHHHALVVGLQASETAEEFHSRLQWIATGCSNDVANFLRTIPMERWVVAGNANQHPMYGWKTRFLTDNDADLLPMVSQQQQKLPFDFLDGVMTRWVQDAYDRSSSYDSWVNQQRIRLGVTPGAYELYDRELQRIGEFTVTRASASLAFVSPVTATTPGSSRHRVDLVGNTCSCVFMEQHGVPCRHMIAAVLFCGQMESVGSRFASCYRVPSFREAYHNKIVELPLESSLIESDKCLAPLTATRKQRKPRKKQQEDAVQNPRPEERPSEQCDLQNDEEAREASDERPPAHQPTRKRRRTTNTERDSDTPQTHRCSKCKAVGHNVRSCPNGGD